MPGCRNYRPGRLGFAAKTIFTNLSYRLYHSFARIKSAPCFLIFDREKAEFLFELNDAVSGKFNHSTWEDIFVEAITAFLLEKESSPCKMSDEDSEWLLSKIRGDKQLDKAEKALLANVKQKATKLPAVMNSKFMFLNLSK